MKEALVSRVGRIISGSVNALVTAMENAAPEIVMEEAIREIDGAVDDVRAEMGRVIADRHLATQRLMEENRRHEALAEQLALAVAEGRDDLAEAGIAEQMDIEAQIPVLEQAVANAADQEKELEGYIKALQAKRREMKAELKRFQETRASLGAASDAAGGAPGQPESSAVAARVERAQNAFDAIMERQTGLPGHASGDPGGAAKLAELEELARRNRIQERLAALKASKG